MITAIVTGVDGSPTASAAARTAAGLAGALGAELHIVSAHERLDISTQQEGSSDFTISTVDLAGDIARRTAAELRDVMPDVTTHTFHGKPAEALLAVAEQVGAGLIVVGNKRVQGAARVLGSIAASVAHKAACDVYIAHTH